MVGDISIIARTQCRSFVMHWGELTMWIGYIVPLTLSVVSAGAKFTTNLVTSTPVEDTMIAHLREVSVERVITDFYSARDQSAELGIELIPSACKGEVVLHLPEGGYILERGMVLSIVRSETGDVSGIVLDISGGCCMGPNRPERITRYKVRKQAERLGLVE